MFWLRSCQKCNGDLYLDRDAYGRYSACVQCGARHYLPGEDSGEAIAGYGAPHAVVVKVKADNQHPRPSVEATVK